MSVCYGWSTSEIFFSSTGYVCDSACVHNSCWVDNLKSWQMCSNYEDHTVNNVKCRNDHPCGQYGGRNYWCYTDDKNNWDYCSKILCSDCKMIVTKSNFYCISDCAKTEESYGCKTNIKEKDWDYCDRITAVSSRVRRQDNPGIRVNVKYPDGCYCEGVERIIVGKQKRNFVVTCKMSSNEVIGKVPYNTLISAKCFNFPDFYSNNNKQIDLRHVQQSSGRCQYGGNPHKCNDYNKKGQSKFYFQLLDVIGREVCNNMKILNEKVCPQGTYFTKMCPEHAGFTFEGSEFTDRPCNKLVSLASYLGKR